MAEPTISDLFVEERTFPPSESFRTQALLRDDAIYATAAAAPEGAS